jgi:hypothetical protein
VTLRHFCAARRSGANREICVKTAILAYCGILSASPRQILAPPNPKLRGKFSVMPKKFTKIFEN